MAFLFGKRTDYTRIIREKEHDEITAACFDQITDISLQIHADCTLNHSLKIRKSSFRCMLDYTSIKGISHDLSLYNGYLLRKISNVFLICQLLVNVSFFYTKAETISTTKEFFFPFLFQKPMIWNEKTRVIISPTFSPWLELGLRSIVSFYQLLFIAKKCQKRIHFFQKE